MNDIEHNKAQCWCNRLHKLMKEKNYTQKSFLKEYKGKYGGGTQANISRWLRVGSKIENGKTIGFPSYETMSNLADFFGVSVGYLIGETDYESFEMEKVCEFLGLEEEIVKATTEYGVTIHASVEKDNVFACQFHPEKSSAVGRKILQNFLAINREDN